METDQNDDQWVVRISNELKSNESSATKEMEKWKKHCIYQIPSCISELNRCAYKPQAVSFGPYHHGKESVKGMEEHKQRALVHFLKRVGDYCDYADNDPIFSDHGRLYVVPYLKRDMLMLENQLPMVVLRKLLEFEGSSNNQDDEFLNNLILKFFSPSTTLIRNLGKCLHILDLYRKTLLQHSPTHPTIMPKPSISNKHYKEDDDDIMRSARELQEAGIRFKRSDTQSLKDVSFNGGVLRLPTIVIDDSTETMLSNLVAFERLHVGAGNDVSSYLFFMDNIIDTEMDVAILRQKGIVLNALGSDKDVAKLFNSLSRDLTVDRQGGLDVVQVSVCRYCKKPWNRWRSNLIETYFRNPWAIVSLIAAIVLFALTIIQTVYTILQANQDSSSPSPTTPRLPPPSRRGF
ncbi:UPF0481 protein [Senna tora]|uniref:UPF0481 protein n=1 Tax=Senna tora TaxID=362788 RepID=A0A834T4E4_9FABA|nr:UPF0481 protein [Senna tora]